MPYLHIRGEFHAYYPDDPRSGPEPDGDTLKFKPDTPTLVEQLQSEGFTASRFNTRGMINLRFEGIDALEIHFEDLHQNLEWANAARDLVLDAVGFEDVHFFDDLPAKVRSIGKHPQRGHILAQSLDDNGRIVAFVYPGEGELPDGAEVTLSQDWVDRSLNVVLLQAGLAYPTFYTTMPDAMHQHMAAYSRDARQAGRGMWPYEALSTERGVILRRVEDLADLVIWPKLFRRLARYLGAGHRDLQGFSTWLQQDTRHRNDPVRLPDGSIGAMSDVIALGEDGALRLRFLPEEITILPPQAPPRHALPPTEATSRHLAPLRIIALLPNPKGPDEGHEVITIMNVSPRRYELEGWKLADRSGGSVPLSGSIASGQVIQITPHADSDLRLSNRGDRVEIWDAAGALVDAVEYPALDPEDRGWHFIFGD